MRSLLFVPADDPRKIAKAIAAGADAVILDLEDSVAAERKGPAREHAAATLASPARAGAPRIIVRVNGLESGETAADLAAVMPHRPGALMLPKAEGGGDVLTLARMAGADVSVIAIATETARALFRMESYGEAAPTLVALAWGIEDLSADLGATSMRDDDGAFTDTARLARTLCLVAAKASGVEAIDGVYTDFRDEAGLIAECAAAARDGFTGKLAIHPTQVEPINRAFTPSPRDVDAAHRVVAAFAAAGDPGVIALEGRMLDRPHLERARGVIARAAAAVRRT
jgi:citrate lyase subunit beta / citryl-CoA lyase